MERLPLFRHACATLAVLVVLATFAGAGKTPTITIIDVPNSTGTIPRAINNSGEVAGDYYDLNGRTLAFLLQRNKNFVTLDLGQGKYSFYWQTHGVGINASGDMIGYTYLSANEFGFLRGNNGKVVLLNEGADLKASATLAEPNPVVDCQEATTPGAINALGEISGSIHCIEGFLRERDGTYTTFRIDQDGNRAYTIPQAINVKTQITGYYRLQMYFGGFLRQPDGSVTTFDVPNSTATKPIAINDFGQIAGSYQDENGASHGFMRDPDGTLKTFDPAGSIATQVTAMNKKSEITGFYATVDGVYHGFLRHTDGTLESFDSPSVPNWGIFPQGINDVGDVVGYYQGSNSELRGFVRSAH